MGGWTDVWTDGGMGPWINGWMRESVSMLLSDGLSPLARSSLFPIQRGIWLSVTICSPLPSCVSCGCALLKSDIKGETSGYGYFKLETKCYLDMFQPMTEHRSGMGLTSRT